MLLSFQQNPKKSTTVGRLHRCVGEVAPAAPDSPLPIEISSRVSDATQSDLHPQYPILCVCGRTARGALRGALRAGGADPAGALRPQPRTDSPLIIILEKGS